MENKSENYHRLYTIEDLECILEHIPYEVWMKDKDGKHIYINQNGSNKLGLNKDEIIGKTDFEIRPSVYHEKCANTDQVILNEEKEKFYEHEFYSDKYEFYRVYKFPIKDSNVI